MWTAIWTVVVFVLLLFLGDSILAFAAEQLRERRGHRLQLERERTKQAIVAQQRDELIWRQLDVTGSSEQASKPAETSPAEPTEPLPPGASHGGDQPTCDDPERTYENQGRQ